MKRIISVIVLLAMMIFPLSILTFAANNTAPMCLPMSIPVSTKKQSLLLLLSQAFGSVYFGCFATASFCLLIFAINNA